MQGAQKSTHLKPSDITENFMLNHRISLKINQNRYLIYMKGTECSTKQNLFT